MRIWLLVLSLVLSLAGEVAIAQAPRDDERIEGKVAAPIPTVSNRGFIIQIPPIREQDLSVYLTFLQVDDSQTEQIIDLYDALKAWYDDHNKNNWEPIYKSAEKVGEAIRRADYLSDDVRAIDMHYRKLIKANEALVTREELFFDAVSDLLVELQRPRLVRVRAMRERVRYVPAITDISGAQLDVVDLLGRLNIDTVSCDAFSRGIRARSRSPPKEEIFGRRSPTSGTCQVSITAIAR